MGKNIFRILILLIGLFFFYTQNLMAQTVLRLATVDNFPPFSYKKNGVLTGVAIEVVFEMAQRLGIKLEIRTYPWRRVMESIEEGVIDGGFSLFKTEKRKDFCLYTGIIQYEEYHLFVKKGNQFPFSSIKDLYGKTIGIDRGVFVSKEFEQAVYDKKIIIEEVNDMTMVNVKKLYQKRIDAMIGDKDVVPHYAMVSEFYGEIISLGPVHEKQASYLVLSKRSNIPNKEKLQKQITFVLTKIWEDGTYQKILSRYNNDTKSNKK
ncbi:MAG: amino acid ABC transporter substrate-binding protein [Desulfobacterales bacterium]|nr:amino acid ABC transporter substrate-binding protein [Desulfobacterales bacterium]